MVTNVGKDPKSSTLILINILHYLYFILVLKDYKILKNKITIKILLQKNNYYTSYYKCILTNCLAFSFFSCTRYKIRRRFGGGKIKYWKD